MRPPGSFSRERSFHKPDIDAVAFLVFLGPQAYHAEEEDQQPSLAKRRTDGCFDGVSVCAPPREKPGDTALRRVETWCGGIANLSHPDPSPAVR